MEVLALDLKIVQAKLAKYKERGSSPPSSVVREAKALKDQLDATKKFLQEGGQHARKGTVNITNVVKSLPPVFIATNACSLFLKALFKILSSFSHVSQFIVLKRRQRVVERNYSQTDE